MASKRAAPFKADEWKQAKAVNRRKEIVETEIDGRPTAIELVAPTGREFLELSKDAARRSFALQKALSGAQDLGDDPSNYSEEQLEALLSAQTSGHDFYVSLLKRTMVGGQDFDDDDWADFVQSTGGFGSNLAVKTYEIAGFKHPQSLIPEAEGEAIEDDLPFSSPEKPGKT